MSLTPGARLGPYEIQAAIGAGGMGEVYKARDTRLDRTVAIKILPPDFSGDPERRARFEREAKTIAGLNHSHICTLYDVGDHEGEMFLVMEHLTGPTLAERLEKGPLPPEQALAIAGEIADALAAAHRQGVVHRDLKPGNVMLTHAGAKLLDFGLAKLTAAGDQPAAVQMLTIAATQAQPLTAEGVIAGTLPYMAPEQLEGKPPDPRTDIWALGTIVYEMLTGKRAFDGTSAVTLMSAILEREPAPVATLHALTPPALDRLLRACLAKNPEARFQNARDLALEFAWLRETFAAEAPARKEAAGRARLAWTLAALAVLAALSVGTAWWLSPRRAATTPRPVVRFSVDVPAGRSLVALALSPEGQSLAYIGEEAGERRIHLRRFDQSGDLPLAGTAGAGLSAVKFSPDGAWLAYASGPSVMKVRVAGGEPVTVVQSPSVGGAPRLPIRSIDWAPDGTMLFAAGGGGIWRVPPGAGTPVRVTTTDAARGEYAHVSPSLLPGGRYALVTVQTGMQYDAEPLRMVSIETGQQEPLAPDALGAAYVEGGQLLYASGGRLLAAGFDMARMRLEEPVAVAESVRQTLAGAFFSVSRGGDLAFQPAAEPVPAAIVSVDRTGRERSRMELPEGAAGALALSPDGRKLALYHAASRQMWPEVVDLPRGISEELPLERNAHALVWSPDGRRLAFSSDRDGPSNILVRDVGATGRSDKLVGSAQHADPASWSRDGRWLVYAEVSPLTSWDIWKYDAATSQARVFLRTEATERNPALSPDGRWLAYSSDASGRSEVYVDAFPDGGRRIPVSGAGGDDAVWSADGRELFFRSPTGLMRVGVSGAATLELTRPVALFDARAYMPPNTYGPASFAVSLDARTFYFLKEAPLPPAPTRIQVVLGWRDEFLRTRGQ